jgi:hypothetical protein
MERVVNGGASTGGQAASGTRASATRYGARAGTRGAAAPTVVVVLVQEVAGVAGGGGGWGAFGGEGDGLVFPLEAGGGVGACGSGVEDPESQAAVVGGEVVLEAEQEATAGVAWVVPGGEPGDRDGGGESGEGTGVGANRQALALGDQKDGDGVFFGKGGEGREEREGGLRSGGGGEDGVEGVDDEEVGRGARGEGVVDMVKW